MNSLTPCWVAFDTETTGTGFFDRLVELAAVCFADDGTVLDTFQTLINPGRPIPAAASELHHITDADVADQPDAAAALTRFFSWVPAGATMLAHHAPFDIGFVDAACRRAGIAHPAWPVLDTCELARTLRQTPDHRLETLVNHYQLRTLGDAHRAMPDADAVRQYFGLVRHQAPLSIAPWPSTAPNPALLPPALTDLPAWIAAGQPIAFRYRNHQGRFSQPTITPLIKLVHWPWPRSTSSWNATRTPIAYWH